MNIGNLNEGINLSITINMVLATAVTYFIDSNIFPEGFVKLISKYYGLSIIFLLLAYIFIQLNQKTLDERSLSKYHALILVNLVSTTFLLFILMYPKWVYFGIILGLMAAFITANIIIPSFVVGSLLRKTLFKKLRI